MEKLSGLVLDHYDDGTGEVLRDIFSDHASIPDFIKSAHYVQPEERAQLPDSSFALVLKDGDVTLRKYACVDAGNTALAVEYFMRRGHMLPEEAQKVAAANLKVACGWYGLPDNQELEKVAGIGGMAMRAIGGLGKKVVSNPLGALGTAMTGMSVVQGVKEMGGKLKDVAQAEMAGRAGQLTRV